MWPFLLKEQKLVVKRALWDDLRRGDLVVYRSFDQTVVCHRLISKKDRAGARRIFCRADTNWRGLEDIAVDQVVGRVVGIVRRGRIAWSDSARSRVLNRLTILLIPFLITAVRVAMKMRGKR
jgi:hypothetical protein